MAERPYVSPVAPLCTPRLPEPRKAEPRMVRSDSLSDRERRAVWEFIKANEPELHAFLTDATATEYRKRTGAVPVFAESLVQRALEAMPR